MIIVRALANHSPLSAPMFRLHRAHACIQCSAEIVAHLRYCGRLLRVNRIAGTCHPLDWYRVELSCARYATADAMQGRNDWRRGGGWWLKAVIGCRQSQILRRPAPRACVRVCVCAAACLILVTMNIINLMIYACSAHVLVYTAYEVLLVIFAYIMLGVLIVTAVRLLGPYVDPVLFPFPCSAETMRESYEFLIKSAWYLSCAAIASYAAGRTGSECAATGWRAGCTRFVLAASTLCNLSSDWRATLTRTYPMILLPVLYIIELYTQAPCVCVSMHITALFFVDRYVATTMEYGRKAIESASPHRRALVSAKLVCVWMAMMYSAYRAGLFDVRGEPAMSCGSRYRSKFSTGVVLAVLGDISGRMLGRAIIVGCLRGP